MGSCGAPSASRLHRTGYVSWVEDCGDSVAPAGDFSSGNQQSVVPGPGVGGATIPRRTPPTSATQQLQLGSTKSSSPSCNGNRGSNGNGRCLEAAGRSDSSVKIHRSSPAICQRRRPVSWQDGGTNESRPSSLERFSSSWDHGDLKDVQCRPRSCQFGLLSSIPDFSADVVQTTSELEKENAHLVMVDLLLEVLEVVKWNLSFSDWQDCTRSGTQRHDNTHTSSQTCTHTCRDNCKHTCRDSGTHTCTDTCTQPWTHNCSTGVPQPRDTHTLPDEDVHSSPECTRSQSEQLEVRTKSRSVVSADSGFEGEAFQDEFSAEEARRITTKTSRRVPLSGWGVDVNYDPLSSAEHLAQQLVLEFRRNWCPSRRASVSRLSLRSSLQQLPGGTGGVVESSRLKEEIRLRTRMRGALNWTPPRLQIIFTVQPHHRRSDVVALQHFLCAGCGMQLEPRYIKKLRYCEYLGRYFCECCHGGSEAVIPARVLSCWDFGRFPVCDFSRQLLDSVWLQPLFDLSRVGKKLQGRVKELDRFTELQEQLEGVKKLLTACRFAASVLVEFRQLPAHLTERPHLFSMDDLLKVKKGQLVLQARAVLKAALDHIEVCQLCLARGFICEFCREKDVIFPFQTHICKRCTVCRACFHKHCFLDKKCPKCRRIQSRKNAQKE